MTSRAPDRGLLGSLGEFNRDQLGYYERCAREYGDVVPVRFGRSCPEACGKSERVFRSRRSHFCVTRYGERPAALSRTVRLCRYAVASKTVASLDDVTRTSQQRFIVIGML
jgi:hypothetical protein